MDEFSHKRVERERERERQKEKHRVKFTEYMNDVLGMETCSAMRGKMRCCNIFPVVILPLTG